MCGRINQQLRRLQPEESTGQPGQGKASGELGTSLKLCGKSCVPSLWVARGKLWREDLVALVVEGRTQCTAGLCFVLGSL